MLVKIVPNKISAFWGAIEWVLDEALPPIGEMTEFRKNNVLQSLVEGRMAAWAAVEEEKMVGMVLTSFAQDECSGIRNLVIYAIAAMPGRGGTVDVWSDGFRTLYEFARAQKCDRIVGYSNEPKVLEMTRRFGGVTDYVFCSINVVKGGKHAT